MFRRMPLAACISLAAAMTVVAYASAGAQSQLPSQPGKRSDERPRVATAPPSAAPEASRTEVMAPSEPAPSETLAPVPSETPAEQPAEAPAPAAAQPPAQIPAQTTAPAPAESAAPRIAEVDPLIAEVRQRLASGKLGDSTAAERVAVKAFYADRASPVWVTAEGFTERARHAMAEIAKADEWGLQASAFTLPTLPSAERSPAGLADAEIKLSLAVLEYARHARGGRLEPSQVSRNFDQKVALRDPKVVLETVAGLETPGSYLRALHPQHPQFELLRQALLKARAGGSRPETGTDVTVMIPDGPALKVGMEHADVSLVRERLKLSAAPGAEDVYDEQVQAAVAEFQRKNGMRPDGVLGSRTRSALNGSEKAPPTFGSDEQRLIVNMERWRWMPEDMGEFHVWDNIPEYTGRVVKSGQTIHQFRIIVGRVETQTTIFSANMRYVIFGPEWGVPDSIKVKELLPYLRPAVDTGGGGFFGFSGGGITDTRVLERHNLRVSLNGRPVDPSQIDWSTVDIRKYAFIQPTGGGNVLGAVKFRFPNKHDIYMHDTPQRELFDKTVRTFSHGCVRVQNPGRFAEVLLEEDKGWAASRVKEMMAKGGNVEVTLTKQIPVHIAYFTTVASDDGQVRSLPDVYGHDRRVASALAGRPMPLEPAQSLDPVAQSLEQPKQEAKQTRRGKRYDPGQEDFFSALFGN
jgi:L,D-transpeptidase YcbB